MRPTRDNIVIALAKALEHLLNISQDQTSTPDERADLRREARLAAESGGYILVAEIEFKSDKTYGLQQVIDATRRQKEHLSD